MSVYRMISAEKARFLVSLQCELLGVSRSGYYEWLARGPSDREIADELLTAKIREIHKRARGVYGARRVHAELRLGHDIRVSRKRVERLMRQAGISGLVTRKRGRTTVRVPGVRVADDLVRRGFRPADPTCSGRLHHLPLDLGGLALPGRRAGRLLADDRRLVEANHMRAELVTGALGMGLSRRWPEAGLIHHSDQVPG